MVAHSDHLEQLGKFLKGLSADTQTALMAELERGLLQDDRRLPAADFILGVLQTEIRQAGRQIQRIGNPSRLFFQPVEPFLVDDTSVEHYRGLIARPSLNPIWLWLCRDLMPAEAKTYVDSTKRVLLAGDRAKAEKLAREFQDRAAGVIAKALSVRGGADQARERLKAFMGPPRALDDVQRIVAILKVKDGLARLEAELPSKIADLQGEQLDNIIKLLSPLVGGKGEGFIHALALVKTRLVVPCQLVRLATITVRTNKLTAIAKTPYGMAIALAFSDLEDMVSTLRKKHLEGQLSESCTLVKDAFDALHLLETELNFGEETPWARRYATIRGDLIHMVGKEINAIPDQVENLVQPRRTTQIIPGSVLDSHEISRTEKALMLIQSCKSSLSNFVSVETLHLACLRIKQCIDQAISTLVGAMFQGGQTFRKFYRSQIEAALRIATKLFGQQYASGLSKTIEHAVKSRHGAGR